MISGEQLLSHPNMRLFLQGKGKVTSPIGRGALKFFELDQPNVLLVTSASYEKEDAIKYAAAGKRVFGKENGASVSVLHKFGQLPTATQIEHEVGKADMVWFTGGSSQLAMDILKTSGADVALNAAAIEKPFGGGSFGCIAMAKHGMSYYTDDGSNQYINFDGFGYLDAVVSPHLDFIEPEDGNTLPRSHFFMKFLTKGGLYVPVFGIGVDHEAGLGISATQFQVFGKYKASGVTTYQSDGMGQLIQLRHQQTEAPQSIELLAA